MTVNGENSIQDVAYTLFTHVAFAEKKAITAGNDGDIPTKAWILDTFAECLQTVQGAKPIGHI